MNLKNFVDNKSHIIILQLLSITTLLAHQTITSTNPANFTIECTHDKNDLGKLIIAKPISADNTASDYVQYQLRQTMPVAIISSKLQSLLPNRC